MKYHLLLTIIFFLLISYTGFAQESQLTTVNQTLMPVQPDSSDFDLRLPFADTNGATVSYDGLYFGMPVVKPGLLDAKMKYWWPSTDYHYTMPNAYPEKWNPFRFNDPKKDN